MKKVLSISSLSLFVFILIGCSTNNLSDDSNNIENLGEESEFEENVNELEDVSIKLNKDTYQSEDDNFEITVINNSEEEVSYGVDYLLEFKKDEIWYEVEPEEEPGFVLILMTLPPGSEDTDEINLDFYEPLEEGKYRVVRHIEEEPMTAEFEVTDK